MPADPDTGATAAHQNQRLPPSRSDGAGRGEEREVERTCLTFDPLGLRGQVNIWKVVAAPVGIRAATSLFLKDSVRMMQEAEGPPPPTPPHSFSVYCNKKSLKFH